MNGAPERPNRRPLYLAAALLLIAVAAVSVAVAGHTKPEALSAGGVTLDNGPKAPALHAKGWINSPPLQPSDLAGKVVVYDFWTYSCINCVRTLPYVRAWYDRYAKDGLVVVGVHSPEFDFEKSHANVQQATKHLNVDWPVTLDDDHTIWNAFSVQYWPTKIVTDRSGHIRYTHIGEGGYAETEDVLRKLLGVSAGSPRAAAPGAKAAGAPPTSATEITDETYLGTERGDAGAQDGTATYPPVPDLPVNQAALVGSWTAGAQEVQSTAAGSTVLLHYRAREVNLVLATAGAPVDATILLDGKPLPAGYRTVDTHTDAQGDTTVHVDHADLYRLVLGPGLEEHQLQVVAGGPGLQAFAFTFGA